MSIRITPAVMIKESHTAKMKESLLRTIILKINKIIHKMNESRAIFISEALDMAIEALEQKPKWILVSERLPKDDKDYLVIDADGNCAVGYYREDYDAWDSSEFGWLEQQTDPRYPYIVSGIGKVVAWMPLPELYKTESEE